MTAEVTTREQHHARGEFSATRISGSRLNSYAQCGVAFRKQYIEGLPEARSGSAALFGNVMHAAAEKWGLNRDQPLVPLVAQAWLEVARGTAVADFVAEYQLLSVRAMQKEKEIRDAWAAKGKESKAPRMTKDWKDSPIAREINELIAAWLPRLNDSPWRFTESDPLPSLYDESLILGKRYGARWRHLPSVLVSEFGFLVEWRGFQLRGFIDAVEPILTREGQIEGIAITDYKTYRAEPPEAKDWRAAVLYDIGLSQLRDSGQLDIPDVPVVICMDYMRLLKRKTWVVGEEDREAFHRELLMYQRGVEAEVFLPAEKNRNPDFCPYPEDCCLRTRGSGTAQPVEMDWGGEG